MTLLHNYPDSWCGYCEDETPYDGWDIAEGGLVQFYCSRCGKVKEPESAHVESLPLDLQQEIYEVVTDA